MEQLKKKLEQCTQYIGTKIIRAGIMTRGQFHIAKYGSFDPVRAGGDADDEGWVVLYEDGYISWSPRETFAKAYRSINTGRMTFGLALEALKMGKRVAREGWNGKGMWITLQSPDENSKMTLPYLYIEYPVGHIAYPNGSRVPWLASQTDMLSEDWMIVE